MIHLSRGVAGRELSQSHLAPEPEREPGLAWRSVRPLVVQYWAPILVPLHFPRPSPSHPHPYLGKFVYTAPAKIDGYSSSSTAVPRPRPPSNQAAPPTPLIPPPPGPFDVHPVSGSESSNSPQSVVDR